ncbi:substrate-binding domain-containing protein [Marinilabilia salmonicolor]|jgi:molybdenum ABC transporter molybdate-binding protein|uniref:Molybdenum ABC transporter molybdate-binding protein n=1 Tax=Marinilabilia salmonicolor TaxID=989 RepID=A0A2T0XRU9_9BACT|nr:substrate-binding domain-containing protein [Marinilabilia salmonicolor]PRZ01668.1 molybdenum ABC transporter molybdate-binding protein [Marinilabilia salmonicolor]RCW31608.1 molybdenum ABC transporter molybdate-binding protein [Marinilabilia salmonicolor]
MPGNHQTERERLYNNQSLIRRKLLNLFPFVLFSLLVLLFTGACNTGKTSDKEDDPDIIIYCENGILAPILEIVQEYEDSTGLHISIQNDCARNLVNLIHYRREADIFIPDSREAIDKILLTSPEIIADSVSVGNQTLVFIVPKKNPLKLTGELKSLTTPANGIILANPESSTLGFSSGTLLQKHQIYDQVMNSVLFLTADSRSLVRNIANNHASLAIAWESDYLTNSIRTQVDTLSIASPHKTFPAVAVLLNTGKQKEKAVEFLSSLNKKNARKIFEKYGIRQPI